MTPKPEIPPFSKLPFKQLPFSSCFRTLKTSVWTKEFQVIIVGIQSFLSYPTLLAKPAPAMNIRAVSGKGSIFSLSSSSYFFSRKTLLWLWSRWKSASGILIWNAFSHRNCFKWLFRRRQWNTWSSHFRALLDSYGQLEFYNWVWGRSLSLELHAYVKKCFPSSKLPIYKSALEHSLLGIWEWACPLI